VRSAFSARPQATRRQPSPFEKKSDDIAAHPSCFGRKRLKRTGKYSLTISVKMVAGAVEKQMTRKGVYISVTAMRRVGNL
jgi:hypothetical protein